MSVRRAAGSAGRSFEDALRQETDLATAQAVIVVAADGSLTLLGAEGLDRARLAEALVGLAFDQASRTGTGHLPTQRGAQSP